jgi:hypothetical protein
MYLRTAILIIFRKNAVRRWRLYRKSETKTQS